MWVMKRNGRRGERCRITPVFFLNIEKKMCDG